MARSSGVNILSLTNTWSSQQTFNGGTILGGFIIFNSQWRLAVVALTTTATLTASQHVALCDATGAAFTVSLPAAPGDGEVHMIKKIDASVNAVTVSGNGHNVDGAASQALGAQNVGIIVVYSNTKTAWFTVGQVATTIL